MESLKSYCQRRGWNLATASVAWVLEQPGITSAIVGASRPEQLEATLDATELVVRRRCAIGIRRDLVVDATEAADALEHQNMIMNNAARPAGDRARSDFAAERPVGLPSRSCLLVARPEPARRCQSGRSHDAGLRREASR